MFTEHVNVVYSFLCRLTVELTAHQLHSQGAGHTTHHRNNADILGNDWGVKEIGLGAIVVHITHKYLGRREVLQNLNIYIVNITG